MKTKKICALLLSGALALGALLAPMSQGRTNDALPDDEALTASAASTCVVDTATKYQTIKGFGGMNHPEWVGDLTESQRATAFGNGANQLGLTICRVFVNSDKNQWSRALATAKSAQAQGALVFASPWNPPDSMCETFSKTGDADAKRLKKSSYAAYAQHLNDFVSYMKTNGVSLYAISMQNEPDWGFDWTWWTEDECVDFLANYADKINCPVMSPESFSYKKSFYEKILANAKANANTDIWGTHFYGTSRENMDFPKLENDRREIFMTEVYTDSKSDADVWSLALDVPENIHNGLVVGNMNAYVWWYIRRSYGPIKENGSISKRGYCMAQYAKFIRPGDVRIAATEQPADKVFVSAYQNADGQVTIVALNKSTTGYTQSFRVGGGEAVASVDCYRTSANENLVQIKNIAAVADGFQAQLPAESVSTFVVSVTAEPDENGCFFHDTFETATDGWEARGGTKVELSGKTPYQGTNALLVSNRTSAWNGAQKPLSAGVFKPGSKYSFSACVKQLDGSATEQFYLSLQYTDAAGETKYAHIDQKTATNGEYVQLYNPSYEIPAGASGLLLYIESVDSTMNFYVDEAIGAVAGTVIDGPAEISFLRGDVNADGVMNGFDLLEAKRGLIREFADTAAKNAADVDQSGTVTKDDITLLRDYLLHKITEFPKAVATVAP